MTCKSSLWSPPSCRFRWRTAFKKSLRQRLFYKWLLVLLARRAAKTQPPWRVTRRRKWTLRPSAAHSGSLQNNTISFHKQISKRRSLKGKCSSVTPKHATPKQRKRRKGSFSQRHQPFSSQRPSHEQPHAKAAPQFKGRSPQRPSLARSRFHLQASR